MTAAPITTAAGRLSPTVLPYPAAMLPVCMTKVVEGVELVCELCADTGAEVADWLAAAGWLPALVVWATKGASDARDVGTKEVRDAVSCYGETVVAY